MDQLLEASERLSKSLGEIITADAVHIDSGLLSHPRVFAGALMCRTLQNQQGVLVTVRARLLVEARTLTRSCVENLILTRRLHAEGDDFATALLADGDHQRLSRARILQKFAPLFDDEHRGYLDADYRSKGGKKIGLSDKQEESATFEPYVMYRLISDSHAHASSQSLGRHLIENPETGTIEIILQPPVGDDQLCDTLYCAAAAAIDQATTYASIVDRQAMHGAIEALAEDLRAVAASAGVDTD